MIADPLISSISVISAKMGVLSFYFTVIILKEEDIATYTVKAVGDPRTMNKILYMSPPANILSFNEIISLWERKIRSTLEKMYILEDELLKNIRGKLEKSKT